MSISENMDGSNATKTTKYKVKLPSPSLSERSLSGSSISENHARLIFEKMTTRRLAGKSKDCTVKRSKGGGEVEKVYQRFTRVSVREDTADLEELTRRSVATQVYVLRDF